MEGTVGTVGREVRDGARARRRFLPEAGACTRVAPAPAAIVAASVHPRGEHEVVARRAAGNVPRANDRPQPRRGIRITRSGAVAMPAAARTGWHGDEARIAADGIARPPA